MSDNKEALLGSITPGDLPKRLMAAARRDALTQEDRVAIGQAIVRIQAAPADDPMPDTDHKAMGLAYGWLWHATTSDPRIHAARAALLGQLSRDDQRAGIRAARAAGAIVDEAALEAALNRGDAL